MTKEDWEMVVLGASTGYANGVGVPLLVIEILTNMYKQGDEDVEIEKIKILSSLDDIEDNNVDVCVKLEDQREYTVVVATINNINTLIKKAGKMYLNPGCPFIIVEKLTTEIIESALIEYAKDDAYWLKLYHIASELETGFLDKLMNQE